MALRIFTIIILFLVIVPILIMIPISFSSSYSMEVNLSDFSVQWYDAFFNNDVWVGSLWQSIVTAFFVAIISTVIGGMAAMAMNRLEFKGKSIFMNLMIAPMVIPVIVVGIATYRIFSIYKLNDTLLGVVLGHTIVAIPVVFVTVLAGLNGIDRTLENAAQSLGSTPIGSFFKITVPLLSSSIFAGFFFAFSMSLDEVIISIFVTGPTTKTLPMVLWENMRTQLDPTIAVAATILIVGTVTIFAVPKIVRLFKVKKEE